MSRADLIAGLDMGSGRVTCLIGAREPKTNRIQVLGGASMPCPGLSGGGVVDIQKTTLAVELAMNEAEAAAGNVAVTGVYLGVRGTHLHSLNNKGALNIARTDREITEEDVRTVVTNAAAVPLSGDCEILHVLPQSFSVDRQCGVPNPVGMEGSTLEVEVHVITASTRQLNNLTKSVSSAGFEVLEVVYGLLATGEHLLSPEERELGTLLVDLGGQSLSLGIYSKGALRHSKEIAIGSDFITHDLAVGLRTSIATAEGLKRAHGLMDCRFEHGSKEIEYRRIDGRTVTKVKSRKMMSYVVPRVEEIFTVIGEEWRNSPCADVVGFGGVVLTGGGSLMRGIAEAAEKVLGLDARVGLPRPEQITGDERWLSPIYATAMGLLAYGSSSRWGAGGSRPAPGRKPAWMRRLLGFLKGLL